MAAVTAAIAAGTTLAGMGINVAQLVKQNKLQQQASQAAEGIANKLGDMQMGNAYEGLQVPTMGYDLAQQGLDRQTMAALQTAQGAGAEGVIGGVGRINEAANEQELKLMAGLQEAEFNRDKLRAQGQQYTDAVNLENARELEKLRLTGAQQAAERAALNKQQAIKGLVSGAVSGLGYADALTPLYKKVSANKQDNAFTSSGQNLASWAPEGTTSNGNQSYAPGQTSYDWSQNYIKL